MIKYKLICKNCELSFNSWFSSSKEYEKLSKKKFLNCYSCNSTNVEKSLMAPRLINRFEKKNSEQKKLKFKKMNKTIKEYQRFIKNNFEYVGDNFAYEARTIHYNNKKNNKGIYGKASNNEIKELKEEGIETVSIPWFQHNKN